MTFLVTLVHVSYGQELLIPENYSVLDSVSSDLDKVSIVEVVVAYNTRPENEIDGVVRELIIDQLKNNKWTEWKKSD